MARHKNIIPSRRMELNVRVAQPITDPRVQKAVDWVVEMNKKKKAAPMAWALLVSALNGELGSGVQAAVEAGAKNSDEAVKALEDAIDTWIS
jgi:hypothetical protein